MTGTHRSNAGSDRLARQIDHHRIARRAYEIYELHGRTPGRAEQDWLQAEAEYAVLRATSLAAVKIYSAVLSDPASTGI